MVGDGPCWDVGVRAGGDRDEEKRGGKEGKIRAEAVHAPRGTEGYKELRVVRWSCCCRVAGETDFRDGVGEGVWWMVSDAMDDPTVGCQEEQKDRIWCSEGSSRSNLVG